MSDAKATEHVPALFLSGVVVNWVALFLWAWLPLSVAAVAALLILGTVLMFAGALMKK